MKRLLLAFSFIGFAGIVWAQDAISTDAGLLKLLGDIVTGAKGGHWIVASGALLTLALAVLKRGNKIPILVKLNIPKYLNKIPAKNFAVLVASLTGLAGLVTGLSQGQALLPSLVSGIEIGIVSAGTHEATKNNLQKYLDILLAYISPKK